ncbi:bifunctional 2-polyprenyl-6-hydroxyphenol methylase/3-demethylubiquinol 3-O-methyltransferase UbiG [Sporosarcina sp. JAI121]|uniref:class I SAM-dependent methyltransferase n=1 Tax=Sporosarcina sp. JAI121 TaxID=2723064 RepID=UPI0015CB31BF|nr:class I SAM-dependent methyltransferase [Sporosarcina sp. JAI121]NYF25828.1 2-polyprenyl-3-methyl-5-hydroxy-6-metoxy-1,4-benzoquinol methylase [Sporosarcina sp. JAI121]
MTNSWNDRFSVKEYVYGKEPNGFLVEAAQKLPKGKVLCIAEGEGRNSVYLASLGFDVTAWDYAPAGLEKTKQLADEKGVVVKTELQDLADVMWVEEQWDAIVHIFGHFPNNVMDRTLAGIKKALKPGGYYISELYTKEQIHYGTGGPRNEEMLCDPVKMLEHFDGYFVKHFHIGEVNRVEGQLHTGTAHVVQSLFQKREEE